MVLPLDIETFLAFSLVLALLSGLCSDAVANPVPDPTPVPRPDPVRIFNIGIGRSELADVVTVGVNSPFITYKVKLNDAKGSVSIGPRRKISSASVNLDPNASFRHGSAIGAGTLVDEAYIMSGPPGVRCFFSGEPVADRAYWLSRQFAYGKPFREPFFNFFATQLWCYLPVRDVVRLMIAPPVDGQSFLDVPIVMDVGGITYFGQSSMGYRVHKIYIIDGNDVRCHLRNVDRRLAMAAIPSTYFTADAPIQHRLPGRWTAATCFRPVLYS